MCYHFSLQVFLVGSPLLMILKKDVPKSDPIIFFFFEGGGRGFCRNIVKIEINSISF